MFRESDIISRNPHRVNQPVPTFQAHARAAKFDEGSVEVTSSRGSYPPEPVPTTWDTKLDPSHRDADWAGLVSKENHRRHSTDHRSQMSGIMQSEHGLVSIDEKNEWLRKRRDNNANTAGPVGPLISGTGASDSERFRTNSHRMEAREPTSRDQMTIDKRTLPRRSLADMTRSNTSSLTFDGSAQGFAGNSQYAETMAGRQTSVGGGSGGLNGRSGSMLMNIGQAIVRRLPGEEPSSSNRVHK